MTIDCYMMHQRDDEGLLWLEDVACKPKRSQPNRWISGSPVFNSTHTNNLLLWLLQHDVEGQACYQLNAGSCRWRSATSMVSRAVHLPTMPGTLPGSMLGRIVRR